jgi:hypothetical protein
MLFLVIRTYYLILKKESYCNESFEIDSSLTIGKEEINEHLRSTVPVRKRNFHQLRGKCLLYKHKIGRKQAFYVDNVG